MKSKSKRLLSTMLAFALVLGLFAAIPLSASAADVAPTNLKATSGTNSITLTWTDNSSNEIGFYIARKQGATGAWNDTFAILGPNVTTYTDTTAQEGEIYYYRVRAFMKSATSIPITTDWSNETNMFWVAKPAAPSNLTATAGATGITLTWKDNSNNETGFEIQRGETESIGHKVFTVSANTTSYVDTTAEAGVTYEYIVNAYREVGGLKSPSGYSNKVTVTMGGAAAPSFVAVTDITGVPATAAVGTPLTLTGTTAPATATNKTITWSVGNAGATGATISGSTFNATAAGTATVTATVANGATASTAYTKNFSITVSLSGAPAITGPTTMSLAAGYAATSTGVYTITGTPAPTVAKTSGNASIVWNDSTKKLDIEAGLAAGTYPVVLTATSGTNTTTLTFTLTVTAATVAPPTGSGDMANFTKSKTYTSGMFSDVNENQWYGFTQQKVVANAYEYGLMQGSGNTFNPTGNMTIAEAITIAVRVHHIYNGGDGQFTQGSPWYQVYVDYAISNGIIGTGTLSDYNKAATRAEMAYIFSRSLPQGEFAEKNTVNSLPDVTGSTPYRDSIFMLYKAGVMAGSDSIGTFNPGSNITRAEASAIISREILPVTRISGKTF